MEKRPETVDQTIQMDGAELRGRNFVRCTLVYAGGKPPSIEHCGFDSCKWKFVDSAGTTLQLMRDLHASIWQKDIEQALRWIRHEVDDSHRTLH